MPWLGQGWLLRCRASSWMATACSALHWGEGSTWHGQRGEGPGDVGDVGGGSNKSVPVWGRSCTHLRVCHVLGVELGGGLCTGRQAGGPPATVPPLPLRQLHRLLSAGWLPLPNCTCWRYDAPVASRGAACRAAGEPKCHVGDLRAVL